MYTFFDSDHVECVIISEAQALYPHLNWEFIAKRFGWDIHGTEVMALADLNLMIRLKNENMFFGDVEYEDVAHCSVCRAVLLPDDECYEDAKTGEPLCDRHARFNEADDMYYKDVIP